MALEMPKITHTALSSNKLALKKSFYEKSPFRRKESVLAIGKPLPSRYIL